MELRGTVVKKAYGAGTKSAHDAVMLATPKGTYRLRRLGGNPFHDPELDDLVGQEIVVSDGTLHDNTVIMSAWAPAAG